MYHKIEEAFDYNGKRYAAVEDNGMGCCSRCSFHHDPKSCINFKCEPMFRDDDTNVRFDEVA